MIFISSLVLKVSWLGELQSLCARSLLMGAVLSDIGYDFLVSPVFKIEEAYNAIYFLCRDPNGNILSGSVCSSIYKYLKTV